MIKYFRQFFKYFKEERRSFLLYSILSITAGVLELCGVALTYPFIIKVLTETPSDDWKSSPIIWGFLIILLFLLKNVFMIFFIKIQTRYTSNFEIKIKTRVMRYFLGVTYQESSKISIAEKNKIFQLLIPNFMSNYIFRLLNLNVNFFIFALLVLCLVVKFPVAAVSALVFGILILSVQTKIYKPYLEKLAKKISETNLLFNQASNDAILNLKAVKASNNEKYFYDNFRDSIKKYYENACKNSFLNTIPPYVTEPFAILLLFILIAVISYQNYMEPSKLVASYALVGAAIFRLTPAISRIQVNLNGINSALPMVKEFLEIYDGLGINEVSDINLKEFSQFNNSIEMKDVHFSYLPETKVLKGVNLRINKGEFIGIAGLSGAGKTTLADILSGLYKQDSGEILVDESIQNMPLKIGYVPQEFVLINGTIRENVAFGNPVLDDEKVIEALKKADLYDFVKNNYKEGIYANPFIDSTGMSLGQKQRLAIARAMYSEPDLLILDEATSALDKKTENEICEVLNSLKGKTTIIVIAHRLSTIKSADKIVYIENGCVTAVAGFDELCAISEAFRRLANL